MHAKKMYFKKIPHIRVGHFALKIFNCIFLRLMNVSNVKFIKIIIVLYIYVYKYNMYIYTFNIRNEPA